MNEFEVNPFYELIINDLMNHKYSVVDAFFTAKEIELLRANLKLKRELSNFKQAAIGNNDSEQIIEEIRGDSILWLDEDQPDEVEKMYFEKMNNFIAYVNQTCYLGLQGGEFHYACYPPGTFYKRHLDTFHTDTRRTLSMVLYLNDEDWNPSWGGELAIYLKDEHGVEYQKNIHALPGRMIIFNSKALEHEVKMVNHVRYSITGWLKTR
ncbi:2OG-Fe(II) oxygenase [Myroides pelagicus]|uniref:Oxidoreductase n=1 Tax=Myroides pelagicus TaxID=270914 RepID=A0A7K1GM53_9FLAO|nr:2OG-Fe(II) oxygenase [Myroides pelagicus]MEC4113354.1 2OG-Fe(II) oxygenase [Myroides pelagicus]MTH29965.1 oxidoreductase [Myroides pelagicus]